MRSRRRAGVVAAAAALLLAAPGLAGDRRGFTVDFAAGKVAPGGERPGPRLPPRHPPFPGGYAISWDTRGVLIQDVPGLAVRHIIPMKDPSGSLAADAPAAEAGIFRWRTGAGDTWFGVDPRAGKLLWSRPAGTEHCCSWAVPVGRGRAVVSNGPTVDLVATATGKVLASWPTRPVQSSLAALEGGDFLVGTPDAIRRLAPATGRVVWELKVSGAPRWLGLPDGYTAASLVAPDTFVWTVPAGPLALLTDQRLYLLDTAAGALRWSAPAPRCDHPLLLPGLVLLGCMDPEGADPKAFVARFERESGKPLPRLDLAPVGFERASWEYFDRAGPDTLYAEVVTESY